MATGESYTAARRRSGKHEQFFEDDCCANCLKQLPDALDGLFCSELCMQTADTVRYWRRVARDGRAQRPDVRNAIRTRVAFLLAGGYGARARRLSHEVRSAVIARDGGVCRRCGKPGIDIDHIGGDSAELSNLQLLCKECHNAKTRSRMVPASAEQIATIDQLYAERVKPAVPILLADDEVRWQHEWRALKKARRDRLFERLLDAGLDPEDFRSLSRADMIDALWEIEAGRHDYDGRTEDDDSGYGPYSYYAHAMAKDD